MKFKISYAPGDYIWWKEWHKWFAWHPIYCNHHIIWLQYVERKYRFAPCYDGGSFEKDYREIKP